MNSSVKRTTNIDDLPWEMINELFKHLPPKDLAACSLVNKRWHSIYSSFRLDRLVVMNEKDPDYNRETWWYDGQVIELIELCDLKLLNGLADQPLVSNLKHFCLRARNIDFDLNRLNQFNRLVRLEVSIGDLNGWNVKLNLPKLKILRFANPDVSSDYFLTVDCPELDVLCYYGPVFLSRRLVVKHPETIRKLTTSIFGFQLAPFKNVEHLEAGFRTICRRTLLLLPKLKELRYIASIEAAMEKVFENRIGAVEEIREILREFINDMKQLKGSDFKFRFSGLNLTQATRATVDQIDFGVRVSNGKEYVSNAYFYVKNRRLIDPDTTLPFVSRMDYSELMNNAPENLPISFFRKFIELFQVTKRDPRKYYRLGEGHFLCFLKSVRPLNKLVLDLTFGHNRPSQAFYDQLPSFAHSLYELILLGHENFEVRLNFDFIGKLSQLQVSSSFDLKVGPCLSLESIASLIRHFDKLEKVAFRFRYGGKMFWTWRDEYLKVYYVKEVVSLTRPLEFWTKNPNEILSLLHELMYGSRILSRFSKLNITCSSGVIV